MRAYGHFDRVAYDRYIASNPAIGGAKKRVFKAISILKETWFRQAMIVYTRASSLWSGSREELTLFRLREASKWR